MTSTSSWTITDFLGCLLLLFFISNLLFLIIILLLAFFYYLFPRKNYFAQIDISMFNFYFLYHLQDSVYFLYCVFYLFYISTEGYDIYSSRII